MPSIPSHFSHTPCPPCPLPVCVRRDSSCWIWPSITQNSYQTAELLAYQLNVGRSRIVPECVGRTRERMGCRGLRAARSSAAPMGRAVHLPPAHAPKLAQKPKKTYSFHA